MGPYAKTKSIQSLTNELRQVTAATMSPATLAATEKWSARLTDSQRRLAGKLAKELKRSGFSTGMIKDFKKLGLRSMNMNSFLQMGQMSDAANKRILDQTIEMLEMGASGTRV